MHRKQQEKGRAFTFQESLHRTPKIMIRIWLSENRDAVDDACVFVGLVMVQFLYAGSSILLSYMLKSGFRPFPLIIFSSFATSFVLSPLSILFERKLWPKRISWKFCIQLLVLSIGGVTVFQSLFMKGVSLTSPAIATAMPNLVPGLIFFIAWASRLEKVRLGCIFSQAKIAGTLLCILGAVTMSLMQSTVRPTSLDQPQLSVPSRPPGDNLVLDNQTIIGCMYLSAAVFLLSSQVVLQAITLQEFPAPISLCVLTSLIGAVTTAIVEMFEDHEMEQFGWPLLTTKDILLYAVLAGSVSGTCVSLNAWAMKKRGPIIVSIFNPLGTVISAIFSVITLKESLSGGSVGGMCLMFVGLYCVLWAKRKEGFMESRERPEETEPDLEKHLLA